eukprot:Skav213474  [mRNA]  locus=scaffold565:36349:39146:+ [translate_table: standard]
MSSLTWQAMMSADEAMLGGIPDREAPLPYIPKAGGVRLGCSPPNVLLVLVSHIAAGFAGFFCGNQLGVPAALRQPEHIAGLAAEVAVSKYRELSASGASGGGGEPLPGGASATSTGGSADRAVVTFSLGFAEIFWVVACGTLVLFGVVVFVIYRFGIGKRQSGSGAQLPQSNQRELASRQLAELRLVLHHVQDDDYVVGTPDQDVFVESLSLLNDDLRGIRVKNAPNALPPGIAAANVYALPAFTAVELGAMRQQALAILAAERTARGLDRAAGAAPAGQAADEVVNGQLYWVAAEMKGLYKYGDRVALVPDALVDGGKAVHTLPDGSSMFVQCMLGEKIKEFKKNPASWDHRIAPVEYDGMGKAETSLKDLAKLCTEVPADWALTGPRTARWCVSYLITENLGLEGHHERVRHLCRLDSSSWGMQEHYQLAMTMKYALQNDQVNPYNNLFTEVIFRRLQTIEYAYMDKAREQEAKAVGGKLSLEEQPTFGGITRAAATLMICPDLLSHVKNEVEKDASLAKNLRKAREERELNRKARKGGKDEAP